MDSIRLLIFYLAVPSVLFSVLRQLLSWRKRDNASTKKIPGPQQFPIVGRVHDLDRFCMWKKFKEWADIYGPIYRTSMLGQQFIIVSDENIAQELLVKRGHIYSGRPQIRALGQLSCPHSDALSYGFHTDICVIVCIGTVPFAPHLGFHDG